MTLSPDKHRRLILSVGTGQSQRPLSPIEVAAAIEELLKEGMTASDVASHLQLESTTMISRFRRLLSLPVSVQHLVDWRSGSTTVAFSVATHIARLGNIRDQEQLFSAAIENRLTSSEIQQIIQLISKACRSLDMAISEVLSTRPVIQRIEVFVGAILTEPMRVRLAATDQKRRDELISEFLRLRFPKSECGGRLGADRFSIVGGTSFADLVRRIPGGYEIAVNEFLGTTQW